MWNVFKFFFLWFWLALAAFTGIVLIAPKTPATIVLVRGKKVVVPGESSGPVIGLLFGFVMCVPSYFIARPKRV